VRGRKTRRRQSPGGARSGWNPKQVPLATALAAGRESPEVEGAKAGAGHTAGFSRPTPGGHERAGETRYGSARGTIPWRANPGRGCGAKQTRKAGGGANRRGRAKRRGRTVSSGSGNPGQQWTSPADAAMRELEPQGRRSRASGWSRDCPGYRGQVVGRRTLEEAESSREDEAACESARRMADGRYRWTRPKCRGPGGSGEPNVPALRPQTRLRGAPNLHERQCRAG
jgi:hypothetical protein